MRRPWVSGRWQARQHRVWLFSDTAATEKELGITGTDLNGNRCRYTTVSHLDDGSWVLVRASSNKPELVVVVESMRSEDDMRDLFRKEIKPRLAAYPEIGAFNQEI